MSISSNIGLKIKELRNAKKITLKQLSEQSGLSVGFLSQLERGLSTIAIDSLSILSDALGVNINVFFDKNEKYNSKPVIRSFEKQINIISNQMHEYILTNESAELDFLPREYVLLPYATEEDMVSATYRHDGVEFIYVLEGILTLNIENVQYDLYPGDSTTVHSDQYHNWHNRTNKITRILTINSPNPILSVKSKL